MKQVITTIYILLISLSTFAQSQWEEYLSHEKAAATHFGHFLYNGQVSIGIENSTFTLETITGNQPKQHVYDKYYQFKPKSTITGLSKKQLLLLEPFDFDLDGSGAVSIRFSEGVIDIHELNPHYSVAPPYYSEMIPCADAIFPADTSQNLECLSKYGDIRYFFNSQSEPLGFEEGIEINGYHEGLQNEFYYIVDGWLSTYEDGEFTSRLAIPNDSKIYNDPYRNQLVLFTDSVLTRYDYNDFNFVEEQTFETYPLAIVFAPDGMYYVSEASGGFNIYRVTEDGALSFWYNIPQAPSGQDFIFKDFDIEGLDVYIFGIQYDETTHNSFSIVQKFNLLSSYAPVRNNLAITKAEIAQSEYMNWYKYDYDIVVKNNGQTSVEYFNLYSDQDGIDELFYNQIDESFEGNLAPGDSVTFVGTFEEGYLDMMNLIVPGSDFMFDALPFDNSKTVFIESSSISDHLGSNINLYPNPTNDILNITLDGIATDNIIIYDILGLPVDFRIVNDNQIDVSELGTGQYILTLTTNRYTSSKVFIKI